MKTQVDTLNATPSKRIFLSIIADYDINMAICELIDNALDIWTSAGRPRPLTVKIHFDTIQQSIEVTDDAGGIDREDLTYVVGPGHTGISGEEPTIGIFGVGTKRAVVALAQHVRIRTRRASTTHLVEFDDTWISEADDWSLPVYEVDPIPIGSTFIELIKLRTSVTDDIIAQLKTHLGATYAYFLNENNVRILIGDESITPINFDNWAFPPGFEPRHYFGQITTSTGAKVTISAVAGLSMESSPAGGEYGVYFYCNDRLVARALKTMDVGFVKGLAGKPHADISLTRILLFLNGPARLMPWNSSKSDIHSSHEIFLSLREWLVNVVKQYSSLARRFSKFEGGWPANVFKFSTGTIIDVPILDFPSANSSYLPPLPESKPQYVKTIKKVNKAVAEKKPWTVSLYEAIITIDWILKQKSLEQRNRIALLLLDSTLEIAFKEYLVNESGNSYSNTRLLAIFSDRKQVHNEVRKYKKLPAQTWNLIDYYYNLRCLLLHQKASITLSDKDIFKYRILVQAMLRRLFKLKFS